MLRRLLDLLSWDLLIKAAACYFIFRALVGFGGAAMDEYRGTAEDTSSYAIAQMAVKATDPEQFRSLINAQLFPAGGKMVLGACLLLRQWFWNMIDPFPPSSEDRR